jgi:hypothetical protein
MFSEDFVLFLLGFEFFNGIFFTFAFGEYNVATIPFIASDYGLTSFLVLPYPDSVPNMFPFWFIRAQSLSDVLVSDNPALEVEPHLINAPYGSEVNLVSQ